MRLRERADRDTNGVYLVEGVRFVVTALDRKREVLCLAVCPQLLRNPLGQMVARRGRQAGTPTVRLSEEQFRKLSLLNHPQGIAAVLKQRWAPLRKRQTRKPLLAVERIRSPGNLGSILRTAAAADGGGLLVLDSEDAVDPYDPSALRATMGAIETMTLHKSSGSELSQWAKKRRVPIFGADVERGEDFRAVDWTRGGVIMIGSERKGMSAAQRRLCTSLIRIPMKPLVDSLNVANAASLLLYESYRQRHPL